MAEFAKVMIILGLALLVLGLLVHYAGQFTQLGRLPGDIHIKKGNFTFYFPLATCIILSLVFSLIMFFISRK